MSADFLEVSVFILFDDAAVEHPTNRFENLLLEIVFGDGCSLVKRHHAFLQLLEYQLADVFVFLIVDFHLVTNVADIAFAATCLDFFAKITQQLHAAAFFVVIDEIDNGLHAFCGIVFAVFIYLIG